MGQFKAMVMLTTSGPQPVGELGRRLGISEPAASLLVDRLEERGLAARERDPQDRRRTMVTATPAAEELAGRLREGREDHILAWLGALTDDGARWSHPRLSRTAARGGRGLSAGDGRRRAGRRGGAAWLRSARDAVTHPVPQPWGDTLSRRRIGFVIAAVMLGMLLSALDQTVVGTAMPRIIADLNGLQHYAWVATAYLLASTASMPIWGKLSDAYGRKRFFIDRHGRSSSPARCSAARASSMTELILFRAFQGIGAGAMMPISQAIIGDIFPPAQRAKWTGVLMSVFAVATIVGPLIGGWITDNSRLALDLLRQRAGRHRCAHLRGRRPARAREPAQAPHRLRRGRRSSSPLRCRCSSASAGAATRTRGVSWQIVGMFVFSVGDVGRVLPARDGARRSR